MNSDLYFSLQMYPYSVRKIFKEEEKITLKWVTYYSILTVPLRIRTTAIEYTNAISFPASYCTAAVCQPTFGQAISVTRPCAILHIVLLVRSISTLALKMRHF